MTASSPPPRILGLGTVVLDHQLFLPEFPAPNQKTVATGSRWQIGGPVPTALVQLARFGHRCGFLAATGNDPAGLAIRDDLQREDIDLTGSVVRSDAATGTAQIWVDDHTGDRTIVAHRIESPLTPQEIASQADRFANIHLLHLDGWPGQTAIAAAELTRANGGRVSLDAGTPKEHLAELLPHVELMNCPIRFGDQYFGLTDPERIAARLLELGPKIVTVTDGERGAWIVTPERASHQSARPIRAVDTTGAGDVFCGGLLHGWLAGWSPERMLRFAITTAGWKCERIGNRDALPDLTDIEAMLD